MIKQFLFSILILITINSIAQNSTFVFNDVIIHVGNGTVIEHGTLVVKNGKITYAGTLNNSYDAGATIVENMQGKNIYPGMIALNSEIGLKEIEQARATLDMTEVGVYNPNVRSVIAYNTDSKVIPTVRSNGVLLSEATPGGGIISGQSSVVKHAGWNWEDATIKSDIAMHINWPSVYTYDYVLGKNKVDPNYEKAVSDLKNFMLEAKAYCANETHAEKNLRFEAMRNLFSGKQKLFVNAYYAKEIISAVDLTKELNIQMVLISGGQVYHVLDLIKENNIPVVLESTFLLPSEEGEDVDMPYKLPSILQHNGILFGLTVSNEGSSYWNVRNLPFAAGISAGNGLTKEEALASVTYNNAKILGIDNEYGTLEVGKSATLFVSDGDVLDMMTSKLIYILIQGEIISVENWQTDLYKEYSGKYGIEVK